MGASVLAGSAGFAISIPVVGHENGTSHKVPWSDDFDSFLSRSAAVHGVKKHPKLYYYPTADIFSKTKIQSAAEMQGYLEGYIDRTLYIYSPTDQAPSPLLLPLPLREENEDPLAETKSVFSSSSRFSAAMKRKAQRGEEDWRGNQKVFSEGVCTRDDWRCVLCGKEGKPIKDDTHHEKAEVEGHHILRGTDRWFKKEQRWFKAGVLSFQDVDNGMTMCKDHHSQADNYLWCADETYTVHVAKILQTSDTAKFQGKKLRLPSNPLMHRKFPAPELMKFVYEHFVKLEKKERKVVVVVQEEEEEEEACAALGGMSLQEK